MLCNCCMSVQLLSLLRGQRTQGWGRHHIHALQLPARSKGGSQIIFMPYSHLLDPKVGHRSYSCPTATCSIQRWVTDHIHGPTTTCSIQRWVTDHSHALQPPARSKGGSQIIFMPYNHLLNPKVWSQIIFMPYNHLLDPKMGHKSYSCPTTTCSSYLIAHVLFTTYNFWN